MNLLKMLFTKSPITKGSIWVSDSHEQDPFIKDKYKIEIVDIKANYVLYIWVDGDGTEHSETCSWLREHFTLCE